MDVYLGQTANNARTSLERDYICLALDRTSDSKLQLLVARISLFKDLQIQPEIG